MIIFVLLLTVIHCQAQQCLSRDYGNGGTVCVCNANHCDTIPRPTTIKPPQLHIYTSNKAGLRFEKQVGKFNSSSPSEKNQIRIHHSQKYQKIVGWGGAFTDSTGINIKTLGKNVQDKLLRSYFAKDGIEYSNCRVPIGGTDFSTHGYSYDDGAPDPELKFFGLTLEDHAYKIPFIKTALSLTEKNLQLFCSAWTAPKWMKTNGNYKGGFIKTDMYQAWADYHVKFLDEYEKEGIKFWGITTGNEPNIAFMVGDLINSVSWTPCTLGEWISKNFGPTIRKSNHSHIKIMAYDDQRSLLPYYLVYTFANNTASKYVDGIAVHWYTDQTSPASLLNDTHNRFPEKFILYTEACNGFQPWQRKVVLGSWKRGEQYSLDIIEDLHNWVTGWTDWNMVLDLQGGPTYVNNFVDSPIIVNSTAGEFYKQPMFYHLGHFSKFIPRGSVRIHTSSNTDDVGVVAFRKPDNGTIVVVLNRNEKVVPVALTDQYRGTVKLELSKRSITTILYW